MFTVPEGSLPTPEIIKKAIAYNEACNQRRDILEDYYDGLHPILKRKKQLGLKNSKIVVNHPEYITDVNTSYLLGRPVDYQVDKKQDDKRLQPVLDEYKEQSIADLDKEIGLYNSIMGETFEYIYSNEEAKPRSARVDSRHCVMVYDNTVEHKELFAVMYGKPWGDKAYEDVVVVTRNEIIEYARSEAMNEKSRTTHAFEEVPIIAYKNNAKARGDFEKVLELVDAYNLLTSDRVNDKEQLVEAFLIFYGIKLTPEQKNDLKERRLMTAPPKLNGAGAEYIYKVMQETDIQVLKEDLERDIHKISKTPNLSDQNFAGDASGVAIRYKLIVFEMKAQDKESFMEKGLKKRFRLYNRFLNKGNKQVSVVEPKLLDVVFHRSLPLNDYETSQMILNLDGKVDLETLISQLSFVGDASKVLEKVKAERLEATKLLAQSYGTGQPNNPEDDVDDDGKV